MSIDSMRTAELSKRLKTFTPEIQAAAAVALLLRATSVGMEILVVKRVENPNDPWSGQMALPGGHREKNDRDLMETVIRETLEETGINLLDQATFLGVLEPVRSAVRPEMTILPFAFLLEHEPEMKLGSGELERHVWVTPKQLNDHRGSARFSFGTFPAYVIGNNTIWGLTYTILTRFLKMLR